MNGVGHRTVTSAAFDILAQVETPGGGRVRDHRHESAQGTTKAAAKEPGEIAEEATQARATIVVPTRPGGGTTTPTRPGGGTTTPTRPGGGTTAPAALPAFLAWKARVAEQAVQTDYFADLEFVDVEGFGPDDPHDTGAWPPDLGDDAGTQRFGADVASYNHFIDIRKGPGLFDDYDGYSYERGSAKVNQFQSGADYLAHDAGGDLGPVFTIVGHVLSAPKLIGGPGLEAKIDECIMWWLNDEYVHAPGQRWYRNCSKSVERYSFFADKGTYPSLEAESRARFPVAQSVGAQGAGIPYSVFMPLDNLARFWYDNYTKYPQDPTFLGTVLHAVQDAAIPHHAAVCSGNWHSRYEAQFGSSVADFIAAGGDAIRSLVTQWDWQDPNPPSHLNPGDWTRRPARNWRIDQLVTWVALHANAAYQNVYHGFRDGWQGLNPDSAANLCRIATAMSVHVLRNGLQFYTPPVPDPCQAYVSRVDAAQRSVNIAGQWLKKNLSEEQQIYWTERRHEAEVALRTARQALDQCRAQHK